MPTLAEERANKVSREIFQSARRRAFVQDVLSELSGRSDDLLSFQQVKEQLHLSEPGVEAELREIPLDRIVGSVGRYRDFTRAFLPRGGIDPARWTHLEQLHDKVEFPPIKVFQVGDVYFVRDGNHRVSVARARKRDTIRAYVVPIPTRVPLEPDASPDDLILKSGYTEFLEKTSLDQTCPEQHIKLTRAGGYRDILKHIEVHQFYMGLRSRHYPTLPEAAENWYHTVYRPVVNRIDASDILARFSGRTEADLYLWIAENRSGLQMRYGVDQEAQEAVDDFARVQQPPAALRWIRRQLHRLFPRLVSPQPKAPNLRKKTGDH